MENTPAKPLRGDLATRGAHLEPARERVRTALEELP
jgi:hypothetical protein